MERTRRLWTAANLTDDFTALSYLLAGPRTAEMLVRVLLGGSSNPLAGGGDYRLELWVDDAQLEVVSRSLSMGVLRAALHSSPFLLRPGETVTVTVVGLAEDSAVPVEAVLFDRSLVLDPYGGGATPVDHDYGGTGSLLYTSGSLGLAGGYVTAYRAVDWEAGRHDTLYRVATTRTVSGGRWHHPLWLDPDDYVLVYSAAGYDPRVVELVVGP